MELRKNIVTSDGVKISYQISGNGEVIVLLHGLGGDLTSFDETVQKLNESNYRTVAIDLRGHGESKEISKLADYSFGRLAEDVREVLKAEKITKAVLLGHCYGGMVALVFAGLFGEMLRGLILVDTSYMSPLTNMSHVNIDFLKKVVKSVVGQKPGTDWSVKRLSDDIRRTTLYNYLRSFHNSLSYRAMNVDKITVPTLIIHGDEDSVIPMNTAEGLHKKMISSELAILKGENHIVVLNNPQELANRILTFAYSLSQASASERV